MIESGIEVTVDDVIDVLPKHGSSESVKSFGSTYSAMKVIMNLEKAKLRYNVVEKELDLERQEFELQRRKKKIEAMLAFKQAEIEASIINDTKISLSPPLRTNRPPYQMNGKMSENFSVPRVDVADSCYIQPRNPISDTNGQLPVTSTVVFPSVMRTTYATAVTVQSIKNGKLATPVPSFLSAGSYTVLVPSNGPANDAPNVLPIESMSFHGPASQTSNALPPVLPVKSLSLHGLAITTPHVFHAPSTLHLHHARTSSQVAACQNPPIMSTMPQVSHPASKSDNCGLIIDELTKMFVRCRYTSYPAPEDRYGGDPATYHQFVCQIEDRVLKVYRQSGPGRALQLLAGATKDRARRIVENHMINPDIERALVCALRDLKAAFGSPLQKVNALLQQIKRGPVIRMTPESLEDFYIDLMTFQQGMLAAGADVELNAIATIETVFWRFPPDLRRRFVRFAIDRGYRFERIPFDELLLFVDRCKMEASSTFGRLLHVSNLNQREPHRGFNSRKPVVKNAKAHSLHGENVAVSKTATAQDAVSLQQQPKLCECGKPAQHALWKCIKFQALPLTDHFVTAKSQRRCFNCLSEGHQVKHCKSKRRCSVCNRAHHTLLHRGDTAENKDTTSTPVKDESNSDVAVQSSDSDRVGLAEVNAIYKHRTTTWLKVLPVRVTNTETGAQQDGLALLDGGSDTHLISKRLYDELALTGVLVRNHMSLADGETHTSNTFETHLEIRGLNEAETFELTDVRAVDKLSDLSASVPKETDFERYSHLADIALPIINRDSVDWIESQNPA